MRRTRSGKNVFGFIIVSILSRVSRVLRERYNSDDSFRKSIDLEVRYVENIFDPLYSFVAIDVKKINITMAWRR